MQEQQKKQPEISIIVPVYKTERFLSACISSILAQTFTDFELILVDDGSPDSCPALCDAAAAKDSRIRVIHQKNCGLSGARNAGLDAAEGEWIAFVDSDDTITPDFCAKLYHAAHAKTASYASTKCEGLPPLAPSSHPQGAFLYISGIPLNPQEGGT